LAHFDFFADGFVVNAFSKITFLALNFAIIELLNYSTKGNFFGGLPPFLMF